MHARHRLPIPTFMKNVFYRYHVLSNYIGGPKFETDSKFGGLPRPHAQRSNLLPKAAAALHNGHFQKRIRKARAAHPASFHTSGEGREVVATGCEGEIRVEVKGFCSAGIEGRCRERCAPSVSLRNSAHICSHPTQIAHECFKMGLHVADNVGTDGVGVATFLRVEEALREGW